MAMNKKYIRLNNNTCEFNNKTYWWKFKLPEDFTNSKSPNKKISVINFMYIIKTSKPIANVHYNVEFTTFHSPTLCDGNYNQDNYICTLCYNQNTIYKTYPIKSTPQYLEFYFRDAIDQIIGAFQYQSIDSEGNYYDCRECFNLDLELIY